MRVTTLILVYTLGCTIGLAGEAVPHTVAGPDAGSGAWIVSPRSYWHYHYTFRPAQSWDPKSGALSFLPTRYGALNTGPTNNHLSTSEPPAGWTQEDFDDSGWPVNRAPLPWIPEMDQDGTGPYSCQIIRAACGRTRFLVPDPVAVGQLTLEIKYHGGVIVSVNGKEVGRANIPSDETLAAEKFAEPYPEEAYRNLKSNGSLWAPEFPYHRWRYLDKPDVLADIDSLSVIRIRKLKVNIPKDVLRVGANVLAVENRVSPLRLLEFNKQKSVSQNFNKIPHIGIVDISMSCDQDKAVVSADVRPPGSQAWTQDIHQWTLNEDFLEPGASQSHVLRMAAPKRGASSAQAIIGTEGELSAPSATLSDLAGPSGAKIPASAIQIRWARTVPLKQVKIMHRVPFFTYMADRWLVRYRGAPSDTWVAEWTDHSGEGAILGSLWGKNTTDVFDQLSPNPPEKIGAGSNQPVWITAEVPASTVAGLYSGTLVLKANGMADVKFDVRLQVFDFAIAEPRDFTAYAGVDESPWALAKWAGVKNWSPEHWKLIEQSIQWAGKLGARVAGIPVIQNTELNNNEDTMIKWIKKSDGSYDFDFSLADRYLELWRKNCHSQPDIVVYMVLPANEYGKGGGTGSVTLVDAGTKQEATFKPPQPDTPEGQKLWGGCAKAIREHFNTNGIKDENIHWGLFYDYIGAAGYALAGPLAKELPGVGWARSSHDGRKIHGSAEMGGGDLVIVNWNAGVRAEQRPPFTKDGKVATLKGWNNPAGRLLLPRADSDVCALSVLPPLWQLREVQEMAVTSLYRGFGRISVDGWGRASYFGPFNPWLIYPAKEGDAMNGGVQFEVLREGLQETETRIFLEKQETLPAETRKVLDLRTERIWVIPPRPEAQRIAEYYAGWQDMSWDLYAAAATCSGGHAPDAEEKARFFGKAEAKK